MKLVPRILGATLGLMLASAGVAAGAPTASPVFSGPPGKFAWAELLASGHPADAAPFYTEVFGWRAEIVGAGYDARVTFYLADRPVAGVVHRQAERPGPPRTRWVPSFAVEDLDATLESARARQGIVLATRAPSARDGEARAILADPEGAIFGLVPTSPGTGEEYAADPGEWVWPLLLSRRPDETVNFYRDVLGHTVHPETRTPLFTGDFVLADGPRARAGAMALPRGSPGRPAWLGLVRVADLEATVNTIRALGGDILREPTEDLIGGRVAVASDPFGGVFGLVQLTAAAGPSAPGPTRTVRLRP